MDTERQLRRRDSQRTWVPRSCRWRQGTYRQHEVSTEVGGI